MGLPRSLWAVALLTIAQACSCEDEATGLDAEPGSGDAATDASVYADSGPGSQCVATGAACNRDTTNCCSGVCGAEGRCTEAVFCKAPGATCTQGSECCTLRCAGGACSDQLCAAIGQTCSTSGQCCSGICNGTCQGVPAGPGGDACGTLGEVCTSTSSCCSTNCQGGVCVRAFSCQANGDICRTDDDCCGHVCSATATTGVGRCQVVTGGGAGGCIQDGNPCPNGGTNCCSRVCIDLGSGAPVCQIAGGCRLTGDWCASDDNCCGGGVNPNGSVQCGGAPNGRCDNGQSCNGVGNICGAPVLPGGGSINASQNCCDGRKEVCKLDSSGIPRCFGGCPNGVCPNECPAGYDPNDPACCLAAGESCQFRDQCCGSAPCVPGAGGALVCAPPVQCLVVGAACSPQPDAGTAACCSGTECRATAQAGVFACQNQAPDGGLDPGGNRDAGIDGGPLSGDGGGADAAPECLPNTSTCSRASECCSGICSGSHCQAPSACQPQGASCTASGDCCAGLACSVPPGSTTGVCQTGAACGNLGQACSAAQPCCSSLLCAQLGTLVPCDGTTACGCTISL